MTTNPIALDSEYIYGIFKVQVHVLLVKPLVMLFNLKYPQTWWVGKEYAMGALTGLFSLPWVMLLYTTAGDEGNFVVVSADSPKLTCYRYIRRISSSISLALIKENWGN